MYCGVTVQEYPAHLAINSAPKPILFATDCDHYLVEMPLICKTRSNNGPQKRLRIAVVAE